MQLVNMVVPGRLVFSLWKLRETQASSMLIMSLSLASSWGREKALEEAQGLLEALTVSGGNFQVSYILLGDTGHWTHGSVARQAGKSRSQLGVQYEKGGDTGFWLAICTMVPLLAFSLLNQALVPNMFFCLPLSSKQEESQKSKKKGDISQERGAIHDVNFQYSIDLKHRQFSRHIFSLQSHERTAFPVDQSISRRVPYSDEQRR